MRATKRSSGREGKNTFVQSLVSISKGTGIGIGVTCISILLLALIIKIFNVQETIIPIASQAIKIMSIIIASLFTAHFSPKRAWIKSSITGLLYVLISFFIFSYLNGSILWNRVLISDILTGVVIGSIGGVLGSRFH